MFPQANINYRAVLHYGDTTRGIKSGPTQTWGMIGNALAESCKMEANIKHVKGKILISNSAMNHLKVTTELPVEIIRENEIVAKAS